MKYTTKENVQGAMGVQAFDDERGRHVDRVIEWCSKFIDNYIGWEEQMFYENQTQIQTKTYRTTNKGWIEVSPFRTITEVQIGTETPITDIDGTFNLEPFNARYKTIISTKNGEVLAPMSATDDRTIKIKGLLGYGLPDDVVYVCTQLVVQIMRQVFRTSGEHERINVGDFEKEYASLSISSQFSQMKGLKETLDKYKYIGV